MEILLKDYALLIYTAISVKNGGGVNGETVNSTERAIEERAQLT